VSDSRRREGSAAALEFGRALPNPIGEPSGCDTKVCEQRDTGTVERLDLGTDVELTHLRHQLTFSGTLALTSEIGEVQSFFGEGRRGQQELDLEHLSSIVEVLNDRFGLISRR